jgi:rhodanese-related sulfurtransferase
MKRIDAKTLHDWLLDGRELAILDAREDGEFGASHLFWATPCGLARKEIRARALLPRLSVRVCCVDDGSGLAETLAAWLESIGCGDVSVLDGGTPAWGSAGYVVFSGMNVPSKAFGEWAEHHYETESVDAPELKAWIDQGRDMVVLDSRTLEEFNRMSIPTGVSVPGGELVYRIGDMVPSADTLVVVNCAGRTRSIMGAESLRRAGVPNRIVALRNGTMGWELAGLTCDTGKTARFPAGTPRTLDLALARSDGFAKDSGVRVISAAEFHAFEADRTRTLYVLDVRDPDEFKAGHRAGSLNAPGGQLVQATDTWIGVRGARIVLVDDTGARARMSAAWLRLMGHQDVFVIEGGLAAIGAGRAAAGVPELSQPVETIDAAGLAAALERGGVAVIDLARSIEFRAGHIAGAIWGVRARLGGLKDRLAGAGVIVLTSPDSHLARLAVDEVRALTGAAVRVLAGGTQAWVAAGRTLVKDRSEPADADCIDFYLRPYDRNTGVEEAMNAYLTWEIDLANEIRRDATISFGSGH